MLKRMGKQTVFFNNPPSITAAAAIVGTKEGEGPLSAEFDAVLTDDYCGEKSWEMAESKLQQKTADTVLKKANLSASQVNYILAGDLLNQCSGTHYGLRELGIPFLGIYGACSTMVEGMSIGAMLIDGDYAEYVMAVTSSHFCSSEKQFRFPLEYGGQRTPSAQWTVTGSGAAILARDGNGPYITKVTTGKIVDMGISDVNNMGAAMAPAAFETITTHFEDTGTAPRDYDLILTGDLGKVGSDILVDLCKKSGVDISGNHNDCGKLIFDIEKQDVHSGGSGCGCCGSVFCSHIFRKLKSGELNKIMLVATGALLNPSVVLQGETIPSIAHAIAIENKPH